MAVKNAKNGPTCFKSCLALLPLPTSTCLRLAASFILGQRAAVPNMKLLPRRTAFHSSFVKSSDNTCEPSLVLHPRGARKHGHRDWVESAASALRKWVPSGRKCDMEAFILSSRVVQAEGLAEIVDRVLWDAQLRKSEAAAFLSSLAVAGEADHPIGAPAQL